MKILIVISIFLSTFSGLFASDLVFNFEKFKRLSYEEKVQVVKTYQKLSAKVDETSKQYMKFKFSQTKKDEIFEDLQTYARLTQQFFISEAVADNFDIDKKCAFAGWVAAYDANGLCNLSAVKKDKNYNSKSCGVREIQCNPMLFGKNGNKPLCVDAFSPGNRGASHQCMVLSGKVADPAKNMREIISNIMADPQSFYRLALVIQRLCLCESAEAKGKNKYRDRLHTDLQNSTCVGLIKQLQNLLNQLNIPEEKEPWYCADQSFKGQANQKTIQKDLVGIKAIVDKLDDDKKHDETLKAVCGPKVIVGSGPAVVLDIVTSTPVSIEVLCTEGDCPGEDGNPTTTTGNAITSGGAITSGASVGLVLETSQKENGTAIDITVDKIECKSMKTLKTYNDGTDGCKLSWEASGLASGASVTLDGPTNNSVERATSEYAITITLTDGKEKVVSSQNIAALVKPTTTTDTGTTLAGISITDPAIDFGSDEVPPAPGMPQYIDLGPPFMFLVPGQP